MFTAYSFAPRFSHHEFAAAHLRNRQRGARQEHGGGGDGLRSHGPAHYDCRSASRSNGDVAPALVGKADDSHKAFAIDKNLEGSRLARMRKLEAFIQRIVPLKSISRRMLESRTFGYVTAALPGLQAFLMLDRFGIKIVQALVRTIGISSSMGHSGSALNFVGGARRAEVVAPTGTLNRLAHSSNHFSPMPRDSASPSR